MSKRLALIIAVCVIFVSSAGIVTFLSAQEGGAPAASRKTETPVPALETRLAPDRIYRTNGPAIWRVSRELGVLLSTDDGATWIERNDGLPKRMIYPFTASSPAIITDLAVDPTRPDRVGITTLDSLYLSSDAGVTWKHIELRDPIRANDQLTCLALSPSDLSVLAIGTSFHGFFESRDGGSSWTSLSEPLVPLKLGGGTFEEIASLAYDPVSPDRILFALGFGKGIYSVRRGAAAVQAVVLPPDPAASPVREIHFVQPAGKVGWTLEARTDTARWMYPVATAAWKMVDSFQDEVALPPEKAERVAKASDKYGIYVSSFFASGKKLQSHIDFLKTEGLNSMVVDFKDDNGFLTYDTELAEPKRIGAVKQRFKIDELVKTAHDNGLYLIGRIVVFRDKQLYNADKFQWAAWDRTANAPWRYLKKTVDPETGEESVYQGEYWVDPYSEHVWDYNIAIARELEDKGVDEVQFDYIRFPSDGDVGGITWRFRKPGMGKLEALESFLAKARENIDIPISTDVYGYAGWARISNWVAQNIEMYSRYVDVIQPMFYPSHFPRDFLGSMEYMPRAKYIYEEGTKRASYIVEGRAVIRPYVQAFRIGGELSFTPPVYSTYLQDQVEGCLEGAGSGFTLWNASNDYYMVAVPLAPIIGDHQVQADVRSPQQVTTAGAER